MTSLGAVSGCNDNHRLTNHHYYHPYRKVAFLSLALLYLSGGVIAVNAAPSSSLSSSSSVKSSRAASTTPTAASTSSACRLNAAVCPRRNDRPLLWGIPQRRQRRVLRDEWLVNVRGGSSEGDAVDDSGVAGASQNQQQQQGQVGDVTDKMKLHQKLFPIYGHERKKFILMGSIKFFIIMALTLTRDTKDTMVVTQCGAEAIAFLKIYGVLPVATGFIALYAKLSTVLESRRSLFFTTCIPFFAFFAAFDAFLYPNRHKIQPDLDTVRKVLGGLGWGASGQDASGAGEILSRIVSNWTSALYFVVAELYSSASVGILFWQFANDVVSVDQAKRFYPLFSQMGGLAPIVAGQYVARYASKANDFGSSLHRLTIAVTVAGVMVCVFYHLSSNLVDEERRLANIHNPNAESNNNVSSPNTPKKKKRKMSMSDSITCLASSQYLRLILTLVVGYGLSISFTEITWKSLLRRRYPDPLDYQRFIGNFSSAVGLLTCTVILFGVHVIRILGWRIAAMATPFAMGLLAIPFFACILLGVQDGGPRLDLAIAVGTAHSLLSKTAKYALFDPTTQMAYIPLDEDSKVRGKAAIEVLGSRIGKSGGSLIQQGLILVFGNILDAGWAVVFLFYVFVLCWLGAADRLAGLFMAQTEMRKAELSNERSL